MLTRTGRATLAAGSGLLVAGILAGNQLYVEAAALPLLWVLAGLGLDAPSGLDVQRTLSPGRVRAGEQVRVAVRVTAARGQGLVEVHCPVPEMFELLEGSNLHVLRKGARALDASFEFTLRCTKRGTYTFAPVRVEAVHALGVRAGESHAVGGEQALEVTPRLLGLRRVRTLAGHATRMFPENDESRTGVATTDFREIRAYAWGDPPKTINWKATARAQARAGGVGGVVPLVNEYEREGKKTVWLFVDCSEGLDVGTTMDSAFEHAIHAAGDLGKYYLDRGYTVGAYLVNGRDRDQVLFPEAGGQQFLKLSQMLTEAEPAPRKQTLKQAVERCRAHIASRRPMVVLVTRVTDDPAGVLEAVLRLRSLSGRRRRRLPVVVASPAVYSLAPRATAHGDDAAVLLWQSDRSAYARLRAAGAQVVEWDPRRRPFAAAMWGRQR